VPHVTIKHFPVNLADEQKEHIAEAITTVVTQHFGVPDGAVSIALEPVEVSDWQADVYGPDITGRRHLLIKEPNYGGD
jgi:4-oxalocrotonate tautomerase